MEKLEHEQIEDRFDQSKRFDSAVPSRLSDQNTICLRAIQPHFAAVLPIATGFPLAPFLKHVYTTLLKFPLVFYAGDRLFRFLFLLEPFHKPDGKSVLWGVRERNLLFSLGNLTSGLLGRCPTVRMII